MPTDLAIVREKCELEIEQCTRALNAYADASYHKLLNSNFYKIICQRGNAYLTLHKYDEAVADFNVILKQSRDMSNDDIIIASMGVANVSMSQGKVDEAIKEFTNILQIDPNKKIAQLSRSKCYMAMNDSQKALKDCDAVIEYNYKLIEQALARSGYEKIPSHKSQEDQARIRQSYTNQYQTDHFILPQMLEALKLRAQVHINRGEYHEAETDYDLVLDFLARDFGYAANNHLQVESRLGMLADYCQQVGEELGSHGLRGASKRYLKIANEINLLTPESAILRAKNAVKAEAGFKASSQALAGRARQTIKQIGMKASQPIDPEKSKTNTKSAPGK